MSDEPDWRRDPGPYEDADQALKQFHAEAFGPDLLPMAQLIYTALRQAAGMSKVKVTPFEESYLTTWVVEGTPADPIAAQILAGWMLRASGPFRTPGGLVAKQD